MQLPKVWKLTATAVLTSARWSCDAVGKPEEEWDQHYENRRGWLLLQSEVGMMCVVVCLHCLMKGTTCGLHPDCGARQCDRHCGTEHLHLRTCLHGVQNHPAAGNYMMWAGYSASPFVACSRTSCHIYRQLGAKVK